MPVCLIRDILRLTALFVAKNGRQFMTTLSQREARNYQFDFLRPNHSFYQYFTRLVDQYTELLALRSSENFRVLEDNVNNKYNILGRARKRAEWSKYKEAQKKKAEEEEDAERCNPPLVLIILKVCADIGFSGICSD